jgi:hypothetical protein
MEPRFGRDFSQVRIHTSPRAAATAEDLSARAYTLGQDIVFAEGQYSPETPGGRNLLAHELTHVVQQTQTDAVIQRQAAGEPAVSARDPFREEMIRTMESDLSRNITAYNSGLNSATIRFREHAAGQIRALSTEDQSKLWAKFGMAFASLALPALAPLIGLSATGVTLITGTMSLTMDDALYKTVSTADALAAQTAGIVDYFIGADRSVQAALSNINRFDAATRGYDRHKTSVEIDAPETRDRIRRAFQVDVFDAQLLNARHEVELDNVNAHMFSQMQRMWNLTTVGTQARAAYSDECFMGQCAGDSVKAFVDKAAELFPDFLSQMKRLMPSRYDYWLGQRDGKMSANDVPRFQRDLEALADMVRAGEFGTTRQIRYSEGPAIWQAP